MAANLVLDASGGVLPLTGRLLLLLLLLSVLWAFVVGWPGCRRRECNKKSDCMGKWFVTRLSNDNHVP
jgi:hypothetical protein